ncbi:GSCOCG00010997001-RA-CDS [Cotesia congregata]|nr:GSCOCG00010997001-RA-CDS [Cotesia congregata]
MLLLKIKFLAHVIHSCCSCMRMIRWWVRSLWPRRWLLWWILRTRWLFTILTTLRLHPTR